jgi:hypothetical protein
MRTVRVGHIGVCGSGFLALLVLSLWGGVANAAKDINKIVGADECGECHKKEVEAWRGTHHYKTYNDLARTKEAKEIAGKLGLKRIKQESDCVNCHFTQRNIKGSVKTVSGISCESCHGPAKDWLNVHNDYGGKDVKKEQETPAHKKERLAKVDKAGMIRPSDIYGVANNCYQCHLVPNEKLVNEGGHKAGSTFELVSWSQGEVRHNYFSSKDGKENLLASVDRQRMMFVIGDILELQHSLYAVSKATQKAAYAVKMAKRVKVATARLEKIATLIDAPEINKIAAIGKGAKLSLNNEAELSQASAKVAKLGKQFASKYDGSTFGALDKYLPKKYVGEASN